MPSPQETNVWRFGGLSPWQLIKRTAAGWSDHQLSAKSAQFAYFSMLSLVPLLILTIAAIARLPMAGALKNFHRILRRALPADAYQLIAEQIADIQSHSSATLAVAAVLVALYAGMRLFRTIGEGLNLAFGAPRRRWARTQGVSILIAIGAILLLLIALMLMVIGPHLMRWLLGLLEMQGYQRSILQWVRISIVVVCLLLSTSTIYCLMPAVRVPWHWISPGSVTAVVSWLLICRGLQFYVNYFGQYNKTYGTLAGVVVLLLWFYLSGASLLLGGLVNGVIYRAAEGGNQESVSAADTSD
ncbi:MAG: YihY/virulence factor BrkB family protein [Planctomycetota bacterium]|nr:MAG: YihY/virulence factor BrkB family protein [Planctomycetota bacterium]REJ95771.1 MAG: YihY/virulence factor BrkB family protein [Planctomycetota bacterium]REK25346.1 MAG: YihY/virulence factor BrkB family protein [Planctomycetota bacterium]REK43481.1 MAG: YihY/virulence factor BrkB family protein [Planctomycetota bacterium]